MVPVNPHEFKKMYMKKNKFKQVVYGWIIPIITMQGTVPLYLLPAAIVCKNPNIFFLYFKYCV